MVHKIFQWARQFLSDHGHLLASAFALALLAGGSHAGVVFMLSHYVIATYRHKETAKNSEVPDQFTMQIGQIMREHFEKIIWKRKFLPKEKCYYVIASKIKCELGTFYLRMSDEDITQ